ncbi:glycosyltransferase family 4 protein [Ignavibacterium sp.]|uniref:glycosyltransferase family 4 protein n=1 Tax=Ignavibacterium sp. TaxID=2651167 RepID=UPI00307E5AFD
MNSNSPIFITPFGFQPDYIREISNAFARNGNKVIIAGSNQHDKNWYEKNVMFINIRGNDSANRSLVKKIYDLTNYFLRLYKLIILGRIKIIYDPSIARPILILIHYSILKLLKRKIVLTVHNVLPHSKNNFNNRFFYNIIYKYPDFLIAHTKFIKQELIRLFKIPEDKIIVANHGIYSVINNKMVNKFTARKKLNITESEFVILIFGQQYPYKGTDIFIKHLLDKINFKFRLVIAGCGDKVYIQKLKKSVNSSKHKESIDLYFKFIPNEEIELFFKACDIVCLPYLEGSQSGVLFMSYSFGRPVLATDVGNFKYDIIENKTGEIFQIKNPIDFTKKLNKIKNNIYTYSETFIIEFAKKNYSWDTFAQTIEQQIFKKL